MPQPIPTPELCARLEAADVRDCGVPWYIWAANRLNSLFESRGVKGQDGRGAAPSDIRPETVRHFARAFFDANP